MATVWISIVTYNSRDDLPTCFEGIVQQTYPEVRVVVLDNASGDDWAGWVAEYAPQAQLIRSSQNLGFAQGHNQVLRSLTLTPEDFFLPLNPDIRLEPDYIGRLVEGLQQHHAGWGTGKLLLPEGDKVYSAGHALQRDGYAINIGYGLPNDARFAESRAVFGAPGAAVLVSAKLIAALAPSGALFDETMFMYSEDVDLDWRARRAGWECWYCAEAIAYHRGSNPQAWLRTQALANRYLSVLKNAYGWDLVFYNLPLILLHVVLRLLISPRQGVYLLKLLMRGAPAALRTRTRPKLTYAEMHTWFKWASEKPTQSPRTWRGRIRDFWNRRQNH